MSEHNKDSTADDAQESLVQALESIKNLLEKSEGKLNEARESIAQANTSSRRTRESLKPQERVPVLDDEVPVLSEVIDDEPPVLSAVVQAGKDEDFDIPVITDIVEPEPLTFDKQSTPEVIAAVTETGGINSDDIIPLLDNFQSRMKQALHTTITGSSILNLEPELTDVLGNELARLKNEIKKLEN